MGEFDDDHGGALRRRRFGDGYRDSGSSQDPLGMADEMDHVDGNQGFMEDYAGGMLDEEGRYGVRYRDRDDDFGISDSVDAAPVLPPYRNKNRRAAQPPSLHDQTPSMQRAARVSRRGGVIDAPAPLQTVQRHTAARSNPRALPRRSGIPFEGRLVGWQLILLGVLGLCMLVFICGATLIILLNL